MKNVTQFLNRVNVRNLTNNTQRVLHKLLSARGGWVSGQELARVVRTTSSRVNDSTTARVRDLRKTQFGNIPVECQSASELHRAGGNRVFYYRINARNVTVKQVASVLVPR